ncbi:uncharacterized protein LOC112894981 isoform X2 [Panicum hallii]|uniref:uncharacterized protein LOC112894981 isoform X2 n=1 Tax=Panicum hallii TaxID=206008 RepID=UPI000DF4CD28|nr:uncharacterized protein LOC112894981 isoform X2 [Panicum hallii]
MDSPGRSCRLFGAQRSLHDLLGGGTEAETEGVSLEFSCGRSGGCGAVEEEGGGRRVAGRGGGVLGALLLRARQHAALIRVPGAHDPASSPLHLGQGCTAPPQDFGNIALGKDSGLFYKVAFVLLLVSIVGRLTDLITLVYTSAVIALTIPALLEKSEEHIARFLEIASTYVQACGGACEEYKCKMTKRSSEKLC